MVSQGLCSFPLSDFILCSVVICYCVRIYSNIIQYHIVISVKICTNIFQNCLALLRVDWDVQI